MRKATFKNVGGVRVDGKDQATLMIEHEEERAGLATVRGKGMRKTYTLPLATVVEMIMWRVAKNEAAEK